MQTGHPSPPPAHRAPTRLRRRRRHTGFTLIELLAVIGVMIVLLSFTVPVLRNSGGGVSKSAWDIAGAVEQAQVYAQSQNTYVWIAFVEKTNNGTISLYTFALASRDGTDSTAASNLSLLDKVRSFPNASMKEAEDVDPGTHGYVARPDTNVVVIGTASNNVTLPVASFPPISSFTVGVNVLLIAPDGSISFPGNAGAHWLEFQLQTMRGTAKREGDTAVVQISSLTGRARVYRPEATASSNP